MIIAYVRTYTASLSAIPSGVELEQYFSENEVTIRSISGDSPGRRKDSRRSLNASSTLFPEKSKRSRKAPRKISLDFFERNSPSTFFETRLVPFKNFTTETGLSGLSMIFCEARY